MITSKKISVFNKEDLNGYIDFIDALIIGNPEKLIIFRGQDVDAPLIPKIARNKIALTEIDSIEKRIINEFKRRSYPYLNNYRPSTEWDWLALGQHYGLPTRLLDWTENPLAALWYSFIKRDTTEEYRVVWCFVVDEKDIVTPTLKLSPYTQDRTKVFKPDHITSRIVAQTAWFTVHKNLKDKGFISLDKNRTYVDSLVKINFPNNVRKKTLQQLDKLGVNAATLFPDMDGLSRYLAWRYY
jgi:hypothetical protein